MEETTRRRVSVVLSLLVVVNVLLLVGAFAPYIARDQYSHQYTLSLGAGASSTPLSYGVWPSLSNGNHAERVRAELREAKASFVDANLSRMELTLYQDGIATRSLPIKSKGKEGSWWETPSGLYRAEGKERTHFSSFGNVHMPYSIPFQGNFFIHGWPYYDDGTPVSSTYSGGCIRLEDAYAKEVFEHVKVGMPILVYEEQTSATSSFRYTLETPAVRAASYLVADLESDFVLLAGAPTTPVETKTLAKLITALVAIEHKNIEQQVSVAYSLDPEISTGVYTIYDLLFPLLLEDSDMAAYALSDSLGRERFVRLMKDKAVALGLRHTQFTDPAGQGTDNSTTGEDIFLALKHVLHNRAFILSMSAGTVDTQTYGIPAFPDLAPVHSLVGTKGFIGGLAEKTDVPIREGSPAAVVLAFASTTPSFQGTGDQVSVVLMRFDGVDRSIALIVLDSPDPAGDTLLLKRFAEGLYH